MVPVYTIACTVSIEFYKQHVYLASIYEFYESLVIAAFFLLLCQLLHRIAVRLSGRSPWWSRSRGYIRYASWSSTLGAEILKAWTA
jgi:hypothetical protein